jgi:polyhydroxyalkanoate synthesis regulator protein
VSEDKTKAEDSVVIKKYANQRLYNTQTSFYVTLGDRSRNTYETQKRSSNHDADNAGCLFNRR